MYIFHEMGRIQTVYRKIWDAIVANVFSIHAQVYKMLSRCTGDRRLRGYGHKYGGNTDEFPVG